MPQRTMLLALAATVGLAVPAWAAECDYQVVEQREIVISHGGDHKGAECCPHTNKADCKDKACKDSAGKSDACEKDGDHHGQGGRQEIREYRYRTMGGGGMMGMHGMRPPSATNYGLRYQMNATSGRAYTMVGWDKLFGPESESAWLNYKMGPTGWYGMDLGDQTNTRHLAYAGWVAQNTFKFGAFHLTAGVMVGGGLNLDVTPTLSFQNYNGFFAADPRLSLGWQVSPRTAINLNGNYLFTTRPAAVGGPGVGLSLSHGF
jgi:hypothetical protein